jgi:casein kinase II subunit alpha
MLLLQEVDQIHAAPRESDFTEPQIIRGRYNPAHPLISRVHTNVNLEAGQSHWSYNKWNPTFGPVNRYMISRWLGGGTFSDVFLGNSSSAIPCAVKILKPIVCGSRIRREAKILFALQGQPNILGILDIVMDPRTSLVSLVTEYVENISWTKLVGMMELADMRNYFAGILTGLEFCHSRGIMHRDIKPANVLCQHPRGVVKIADWGTAEFYHPLRKYTSKVGTLRYKAPEILLDFGYYNYAVDIWGVGCMLLGALCKRIAVFEGETIDGVLQSIAQTIGGQKIANWMVKYKMRIMPETIEGYRNITGSGFNTLFGALRRRFQDFSALDLCKKMLKIDHRKRITASEALLHPFFTGTPKSESSA